MLTDRHDFNTDSNSDILWYNTTSGQVVNWLVSGTSVIGGGSLGSVPSPWAIVGQRDFNGDGRSDILWRNGATGEVVIWLVNATGVIGGASLPSVPNPWTIVVTGDFNNDGLGDILWYNPSSGQALIWLVQCRTGQNGGCTILGASSPGLAASPWQVAGTGDFNADGFADILWYNTTNGEVAIWLLQCTGTGQNSSCKVTGGGSPGTVASPWMIAGTGDFNGDGNSDILWYNTATGQVLIWLLSGTSVIGGGSPGSAPSPWTIAETGDFNGDGNSDILWVNTTSGELVIWLLNGTSVIGGGSPGSAAPPWQIQGMNAN